MMRSMQEKGGNHALLIMMRKMIEVRLLYSKARSTHSLKVTTRDIRRHVYQVNVTHVCQPKL